MALAAEDIDVMRDQRAVLSGVRLALSPGECVCVVGPNGAGKSSLMLTLAGLLPAARGRVVLDGRPLRTLSRREVARRIAFVPQQYEGFGGFRTSDVLAAARFAHAHPLAAPSDADLSVVEEQAARCGVSELGGRMIGTLSAGERQKVWLAAALVQEPAYLLLDEPTAALDARYVATLVRLLRDERDRGRGVLVICHDLNVAAALGDRIVALRGGRVCHDGPPAEFLTAERLADIFDARFRLSSVDGGARPLVAPEF